MHEEFHSERFTKEGGTLEMVQLWVNLPAKEKMSQPHYQGILNAQIPEVALGDGAGSVRVIAGEFQGTRGPAKTFTPINVWDLQLSAGGAAELRMPEGHKALLVVQSGSLTVNDQALKAVELASFDRKGELVSLRAEAASRVLVLSGQPLNEPVVGHGPFVMNSRDEIQQAMVDYQEGRMGRLVSGTVGECQNGWNSGLG